MLSCHLRCGATDVPSMDLRVSLYGTRDAAANWEDAHAKVLREHQFDRGLGVRVHSAHA